ncbi:alpha/beta-hydrolase [Aureobasidium sp. EXF-8845]|nr:alpha/beta-hydrolase [Aureobasidium sp. EXF-8845]KAI4856810.1 alpha/beta-hydrolase [Aureobasidium sp. EXF-8846]
MPLKYIAILLQGLTTLSTASPLLNAHAAAPTVTLAGGVVVGTATGVYNQPAVTGLVDAYLGIPYASPPARFKAPVPAKAWTTPFLAQKYGAACIQQFNGSVPGPTSEDCLFANVYVPPNTAVSSKKAVMFWIHGGDLAIGAASEITYDGSSLAVNHDVVVVTFNYRLGIFGFPNSPDLPASQRNPGYLDQRLALQWTRDNIDAFGGDKANITIFGESAGGYSVAQLLANPPKPLPFVAAIMESPIILLPGDGARNWNNVSKHFGCADSSSTIDCLQKVDVANITNYIRSGGLSLLWPPAIDDITQVASISDAMSAKSFAQVPVFMGTNTGELKGLLKTLGFGDSSNINATEQLFALLGVNITSIVQLLKPDDSQSPASADLIGQILTDLYFTCPVAKFARELAANNYDAWRYWYGLTTATYGSAYAAHASEIYQVFGSYPLQNENGNATSEQIDLSVVMQTVWSNFAKDPQLGPGWDKISADTMNELGLFGGARIPSGLQIIPTWSADYTCGLLDSVASLAKAGTLEVNPL